MRLSTDLSLLFRRPAFHFKIDHSAQTCLDKDGATKKDSIESQDCRSSVVYKSQASFKNHFTIMLMTRWVRFTFRNVFVCLRILRSKLNERGSGIRFPPEKI